VEESIRTAAHGIAPVTTGRNAGARTAVVAVGAESAADSAAQSVVPAQLATFEPVELEVATGAAVAVHVAPIAVATVTATGPASAAAGEAVGALTDSVAVALVWSEWPGVGGRRSARAAAAALSESRSHIAAAASGRLAVIAAASLMGDGDADRARSGWCS